MFGLGCVSVTILVYFPYLVTFHASVLSGEFTNLYFLLSPEPLIAPFGDEVNFQCTLNYKPTSYQWKHNSKLLEHNESLNLLKVQFNDVNLVGDYQCIARYNSQTALASNSARLSRSELQPFPPQPEEYYEVSPGNTFTIYCTPPVSNPAALITYIKDGQELPANIPKLSTTGSLLLSNVTSKDAGIYSCSAINDQYNNLKILSGMKVHVKVIEKQQPEAPKFLHEPQTTHVVQAGSNITLECTAVGQPIPSITWRKSQSELPLHRTEIVPGGLTISNVVLKDAGEYICTVDNGVGSPLSRSIMVQVQEPPRVIRGPTQNVLRPEEGGELTLTCDVTGTPEPTIKWLLNAEPLDFNKSVQILGTNGNVLKIWNVGKHHVGIYQCFAINPVGSTYGAIMVNIYPKEVKASKSGLERDESSTRLPQDSSNLGKQRPGHHRGNGKKKNGRKQHKEMTSPITKPNITRISSSAVMVRWSVRNNSGPGFEFFKVQYTTNHTSGSRRWSTSNEIDSSIRAFEVPNLDAEQHYKFRIGAVYTNSADGVGPMSSWFKLSANDSSGRPPPAVPELLSCEPFSPSAIKIQWQYNSTTLSPIKGFYVYFRFTSTATDFMTVAVPGESTREFIITELQADTPYEIKLRSFTPTAASPFSGFRSGRTKKSDTPTKVEEPTDTDEEKKEPPREQPAPASQLYLYIGVAVGGFGLVILICFLCCCFRRQSGSASDEDGTESCSKIGDTALTIQQLEPVTMNGYANHANHANHNGKMLNGRTPQRNGFNCHAMTITNNPLAESEQSKNVMELSYLSSQNNNCSAEGSSH